MWNVGGILSNFMEYSIRMRSSVFISMHDVLSSKYFHVFLTLLDVTASLDEVLWGTEEVMWSQS